VKYIDDDNDDDEEEEVFSNGTTVAESNEDDPASRFNANDFNVYDGTDEGRCITTA
jgi:hypothetical protein